MSCVFSGFGQKTMSEIQPKHKAALTEFLTEYKDYRFLSENRYDKKYLAFMRELFGASLKPSYRVGDFNHDKIEDFAVIVIKDEAPVKYDLTAEPHNLEYKIAVVIFNGTSKGGFYKAFVNETSAPLACFINLTDEKKKRLYFGITETDAGFLMTPSGKSYIVKNPDDL